MLCDCIIQFFRRLCSAERLAWIRLHDAILKKHMLRTSFVHRMKFDPKLMFGQAWRCLFVLFACFPFLLREISHPWLGHSVVIIFLVCGLHQNGPVYLASELQSSFDLIPQFCWVRKATGVLPMHGICPFFAFALQTVYIVYLVEWTCPQSPTFLDSRTVDIWLWPMESAIVHNRQRLQIFFLL